ncbi:syntaxin-6 isoform X1 [Diaphorina citri]|uniref:Syntaxin-6 isoform X1 n=1 Tax=Diaphorina citri TaxID=121845 RepID=A0A3Q0IJE3_DIACI|nr:syntaxin-6 isoform X1 [Diaphorina citri]
MKDTMNYSREKDRGGDHMSSKPLLSDDFHSPSPVKISAPFGSSRQTKYSKLNNQMDSPNRSWVSNSINQQSAMFDQQDSQLDMLSETIGTLKTVSRNIGSELDEQALMLDEMGNEMECTESKLDATMKKVAKVLHISNDRGQWMAILILSALLFVILILFIIL